MFESRNRFKPHHMHEDIDNQHILIREVKSIKSVDYTLFRQIDFMSATKVKTIANSSAIVYWKWWESPTMKRLRRL